MSLEPPVSRAYWLDLFTGKTWDEFHRAGGVVSGFRSSRRKSVRKIKIGDYLVLKPDFIEEAAETVAVEED